MRIFKKSAHDDRLGKASPGIGPTRPVRSENASVTASARAFKRKLRAKEGLIIEGQLECTSAHHEKQLTVGEHARVKANIQANSVVVLGQLVGDIYSEGMVSLARGADVKGNIFCACISIEGGARFNGRIDVGELPDVAVVPQAPVPDEVGHTEKTHPHVARPGIYA
jgi:cytoskeletal protein CcmA (bactofilin family)